MRTPDETVRTKMAKAGILAIIAKVTKVHPGKDGRVGTVDVELLANQMDGGRESAQRETLYGVPYPNTLTAEPAVGDIGPIRVFDRDDSVFLGGMFPEGA